MYFSRRAIDLKYIFKEFSLILGIVGGGIDVPLLLFFAHVVCSALDARFNDNDLISCFKILNPINMPSGQVGL